MLQRKIIKALALVGLGVAPLSSGALSRALSKITCGVCITGGIFITGLRIFAQPSQLEKLPNKDFAWSEPNASIPALNMYFAEYNISSEARGLQADSTAIVTTSTPYMPGQSCPLLYTSGEIQKYTDQMQGYLNNIFVVSPELLAFLLYAAGGTAIANGAMQFCSKQNITITPDVALTNSKQILQQLAIVCADLVSQLRSIMGSSDVYCDPNLRQPLISVFTTTTAVTTTGPSTTTPSVGVQVAKSLFRTTSESYPKIHLNIYSIFLILTVAKLVNY